MINRVVAACKAPAHKSGIRVCPGAGARKSVGEALGSLTEWRHSASCISRFHAPAFLHVPWLHTTRARLTLLFGGTAAATGWAVGLLANASSTRQPTDLSGQSLMNSSQPIALALAQGMQEREREVALLSHLPMLTQGPGLRPSLQAHLEQIRQS